MKKIKKKKLLAEYAVKFIDHNLHNTVLNGHERRHLYGVRLRPHDRRTKHNGHVGGQHLVHLAHLYHPGGGTQDGERREERERGEGRKDRAG